jgi:hypothetical protein
MKVNRPISSLKEKAPPEKIRALAEAFQKNGYQEKARDLRALAALLERKRQIAEPAEPTDVPSTDSPIKPQHP